MKRSLNRNLSIQNKNSIMSNGEEEEFGKNTYDDSDEKKETFVFKN